ncbi:uncharacterized protein GIQ15_02566 [Arthroderma uncinatum]|uniref:uncharacterized protein n=1 Tax=Arthroderma uncinatum TaxID=74035 RepID=UPI00144A7048|nr:uncharacterized protein GIQ15_02566 [Arthroderma uncinatum]KAF3483242.1 hypothetical protein GIQ15_02566 [Arthroderma uncinatum]
MDLGLEDARHFTVSPNADKIRSNIRAMYDEGVPFFTKAAIREVYQQLKGDLGQGQTISVRGLDGVIAEFDVWVDEVEARDDELPEHLERVIVKPIIFYASSDYLQKFIQEEDHAYCSLRIYHTDTLRDRITKEPVARIPSSELVKGAFKEALEQWESSETCLNLQSTLSKMTFHPDLKITKIIAFACANITFRFIRNPDGEMEKDCWDASTAQHALILTLQKSLSHLTGSDRAIQCFAQDPEYTPVDSEVLAEYGINTLNDPEGFLEVDDTTLIISCAADAPVKEIIADIAQPAMILWDYSREWKHKGQVW